MKVQNLDLGLKVLIKQEGPQVHEGPHRDVGHVLHKVRKLYYTYFLLLDIFHLKSIKKFVYF